MTNCVDHTLTITGPEMDLKRFANCFVEAKEGDFFHNISATASVTANLSRGLRVSFTSASTSSFRGSKIATNGFSPDGASGGWRATPRLKWRGRKSN